MFMTPSPVRAQIFLNKFELMFLRYLIHNLLSYTKPKECFYISKKNIKKGKNTIFKT